MKKITDYKYRSGPGYEHIHEDMTWGHLVGTIAIIMIAAQAVVGFLQ